MSDKEVRVRITGDISDLEKKLKQLEDRFNNLGKDNINNKGINELINDSERLENAFKDIENSVEDVTDAMKTIDNNSFDRFADDILDSSKRIDKMTDSMKELNNQTKELSINQEMDDYYKSLEKISDISKEVQDSFGSINKNINFDTKDSGKDFKSNLIDSLVTGEVISRRLDDTFDGVSSSIDSMSESLRNITDGLDLGKGVEAFNKLSDNIEESKENLEELYRIHDKLSSIANERKDIDFDGGGELTERAKVAQEKLKKFEEIIARQEGTLKDQEGTVSKSLNSLDEYSQCYEQLSKRVNDFINDESKSIFIREKVAKSFQEVTKAMEDMYKISSEGSPDKSISKMQKEYDSLGETIDKLTKKLDDMKPHLDAVGGFDEFDNENQIIDLSEKIEQLKKDKQEYIKILDDIEKANKDYLDTVKKLADERATNEDYFNSDEFKEGLENIKKYKKEIEEFKNKFGDNFELLSDGSFKDSLIKWAKEIDKLSEEFKELENAAGQFKNGTDDISNKIKDLIHANDGYADSVKAAKDSISDIDAEIKKYTEDIAKLEQELKDLADAENKTDNYSDIIRQREELIEQQRKLGKELEKTKRQSDRVNDSIGRINDNNLDDKIGDIANEAKDLAKSLSLVDFDTLKAGLDNLGKDVEDKREKLIKFREINKELSDETKAVANSLNKQGQSIKKFADNAGFAVEVFEELIDNARVIGSDGFNIVGNEEALRIQAELIEKNKDELEQFIALLKDSGMDIPKRFIDEFNKLDLSKFVKEIETFGKPMNQFSAAMQSYKQQLLEGLKYEKESIESKRKLAKETLEQARANQQAAKEQYDSLLSTARQTKSYEEQQKAIKELADANEKLRKATEELARAEKDYADINKNSIDDNRIKNARELVKQYNDLAKALREMGAATKDINLDEIKDFDKSLGTNLKDIFPDDTPKQFKDFIEDIKAMFSELGDFEFGNAGELLKDLGKGLLDKLPANAKFALSAITALTVGVNKLYQAGKQQFFEGLTNIGSKLQPVVELFRDFGQEVVSAFESITDTDIDLSSLMELGPNFEYNMQKVGAIAGSNKRQLEELTKTAEVLGGTTQYTASDVAEAFQYMAMAGYDTEEMLSSINGTLALSIASGTGLAETTDIVTDYMTALGLEANSTNDFVDKLAATVTSSNTTVEKYGMSMRQVASQAGALGISMTDLSTAIGLQANAGVKGAKAGTALKNVLANMAAPTEKQEKALKKLGFTADETGSYFKTTADGAVDLEATVKQLMTATDKMTKSQKAAVLAQLAGREALPGLMALLSQGAEGWDELSNTIENSTGKVQYWNECMSLAGKSGKEATKAINNMKEVFAEVETEALNAGLSSEELSHAIAILGDDGKVTSNNIRGLIDVIDSMNTATGKTEKKWRALDKAGDDLVNTGYDYDATIAKITADTTGLSQATKEAIKNKLDENMTYEEANAVLKEYGLTAERVSFSTLEYADKLQYLRDNLKGCSDEEIKSQLANLGLADSFDEVKEIVSMTDEEFAAYTENLKTVKGMAEQLAEAMDETTKSSLLNLASAIENVAITAFNNMKPAIKGAVDAINEFFDAWHNGDENVFTFDGLEKGLAGLADKIRGQKANIQQAVVDLFSGIDTFINGGSLESLLDMGTSVIDSICKGIQQAKNNGSLDEAIDGAIKKICNWIETNGPQIEEAGKTIIDSLKTGIENNKDEISSALDTLCSVINTWASSSAQLKSTASLFADTFVDSFIESTSKGFANKANEFMQSIVSVLNPGMMDYYEEGGSPQLTDQEQFFKDTMSFSGLWKGLKKGWNSVVEWFTGESYAAELGEETGTQIGEGMGTGISNSKAGVSNSLNTNLQEAKVGTDQTSSEIGQGISDNILAKLETMDATGLQALQTELLALQTTTSTVATGIGTSFTNIQNSARTSFVGLANIVRNQLLNCTNIVRNQALNMSNIFNNQFTNMSSIVRTQALSMSNIMRNQMVNMTNIVRNQALNMSNIFRNQFVNMSNIARNQMVNVANIIRNQMVNAANIVRNQCVNMANIFRNQFVSMANVARTQMVNVSNIIRNQAMSWSNVIRNQVTNARDAFTQQMISMANVARTQMVNVSNIVKNQAAQWASVVRSQSAAMKSAFTAAFSGLSSIAASQMAKCLSVVKSYMAQIKAATAQTMTMNFKVNKTMTTTNITKNVTTTATASTMSARAMRTMSSIAANTMTLAMPSNVSYAATSSSGARRDSGSSNGSIALEVPLYLDGRQIAKASAKYTESELDKMSKRGQRKRGE